MERSTPVRKSHTNTSDLLTWSETPPPESPSDASSRPNARPHQPSNGVRKVVFGGQVTDEEFEKLNQRKPCSGYKLKEITGSDIFNANGDPDAAEPGSANPSSNNRTGIRMYQQALSGISHISFSEEESVSPKKPATLPEVAKQRELSGSLQSEADLKLKKQISDAKSKELSGHDIFAPSPEILPRPLASHSSDAFDMGEPVPRNLRTSVKVSNPAGGQTSIASEEELVMKTAKKIYDKKFSELSGNNIFKGDEPPSSAEKPLSSAKQREMSGNDIFKDEKVQPRDYFGGVRKPPGGHSSISLV
ncbi:hypothetical protein MLD38_022435 [Melastoma candidum]|uniref:Uncharacterized protein n=1 Tax=Melastoma candidum TaxID=119954 RepID=A0ACB9QN59_9MYRT|nr:hypothetical protein MLD38_022435 [Melastoma candidum]